MEFYIRLVWLFVIIISLLLLVLCYLFMAMRRSMERESKTLAFSHLVIEGIEEERHRISRELHDCILPQVRGLPVSDQIRSICMELLPPDFSRLSLKDSLAALCDKFIKRTDIECVYSIEQELSFAGIDKKNQLHLYRMIQEVFTNIEKHSKANKATLVVRQTSDNIIICVSDDGEGVILSETALQEGLGMESLRQRANIIGAKLSFLSEKGNGLMVMIEIPVSEGN